MHFGRPRGAALLGDAEGFGFPPRVGDPEGGTLAGQFEGGGGSDTGTGPRDQCAASSHGIDAIANYGEGERSA